jgi:hypothetical protein
VAKYLVDTNVLLRFVKPDDHDYLLVQSAIRRLWTDLNHLCYTSQNLAEFWNTCTAQQIGMDMDLRYPKQIAGLG